MMLFYIRYGCSEGHEQLIIEAESFKKADEYAERAAQDIYYSYDCNYPSEEDYELYEEDDLTEDEISDMEYENMLNDIDWTIEPYDEKIEEHVETLKEQGGVPFEV
jgi:hypothetical protein